jgi:hypothetical protein
VPGAAGHDPTGSWQGRISSAAGQGDNWSWQGVRGAGQGVTGSGQDVGRCRSGGHLVMAGCQAGGQGDKGSW